MELSRLFVSHGVDDRPPESGTGTGYSMSVSASEARVDTMRVEGVEAWDASML